MTRLVWVLIFLLLLMGVVLFGARMFRTGSDMKTRLAEMNRAKASLEGQYPGTGFDLRATKPSLDSRKLTVYIARPPADPAAFERMADSALLVARRDVNMSAFDTVGVVAGDSTVRSALGAR